MPGVYLNLNLPALGDPFATVVAKTAQALNAIQQDLQAKIAAGIINVNATLPLNGNPLTSVGFATFAAGNVPTAAGSIYYNNGEWFLIDQAGVIQLTANGLLNASSAGAIVGMGATTAAVTYVNASSTFQFTSSPGVYAKLQAGNLILQGTNSTVTLGVDNAVTSPITFNVKSVPNSGVSLLVYNAATGTLEDGAVTAISNTPTFSTPIKATDFKITSPGKSLWVPATAFIPNSNTMLGGARPAVEFTTTNLTTAGVGLHIGDQILSVTFYYQKTSNNFTTIVFTVQNMDLTSNGTLWTDNNNTSANNPGYANTIVTCAAGHGLTAGGGVTLTVGSTVISTDLFFGASVTYIRP